LRPTRGSKRVGVSGAAGLSLAGKRASVYLSGAKKPLGSIKVPANGIFRVNVKAPSGSTGARARARYSLRIAKLRSSAQPLKRRLILNTLTTRAGRVTISGQVIKPLTKPPAKVLIQQRTACGKLVSVASVKPSATGRFRVTVTAPASPRAVVYTATTRIPKTKKTTTAAPGLPQVIALD
jgi:hypothetical protein